MTNGVMPTPAVMQGADVLMNSFVCNDDIVNIYYSILLLVYFWLSLMNTH